MNEWESTIKTANELFNKGSFYRALLKYRAALSISQINYSMNSKPEYQKALSSVVISHLNIAECLAELEKFEEAVEQIERAYMFVDDIQPNTLITGEAKLHAQTRIRMEWIRFIQDYSHQISNHLLNRSLSILRIYSKTADKLSAKITPDSQFKEQRIH